jgi:signal transduction histidine kinase
VPVVSRTGTVLGGLFFGHSQTGIFTDRAEHIVAGLAAQAAIAMDNERLYEELQEQVTTHVALNAALREAAATRDQALADAQAALRIRDAFLASISHDLRTPLGTIKGFTQLVLRQAGRTPTLDSANVTELLTNVDRSTKKMAAMIDELLDLTRLEAGHSLELNREPTDLVTLAHGLADDHQRGTHTHRIQIEATVPALVGTWDEARLERVVANLLSNAIKYSPDGGTITITLTREETAAGVWAVVTVRDQGVGIPAVDLPHIFERFRRGANVAGQTHGIGIGLAGSKQIVEQHGGTIAVTSTEGAGTTVTVRLPVDPPPDPDQVTDS